MKNLLTPNEFREYFGCGLSKAREIVNLGLKEGFTVVVGKRKFIVRNLFDEYIQNQAKVQKNKED
ncbi:transposon Tn916 excisionase [Eubacterium ruminantium]|nr:transposon Tn916 excisionase [Eubacterium ruminantium]